MLSATGGSPAFHYWWIISITRSVMSTPYPYRMTINGEWIMMRWVIVRWIINRRIAIISTCIDISRTCVVSKTEVKSWFKVPCIICIKIDISRMIDRWYVNMMPDNYVSDIVFIYCVFICFRIITVFFVSLLLADITKTGITAG